MLKSLKQNRTRYIKVPWYFLKRCLHASLNCCHYKIIEIIRLLKYFYVEN